MRLLLRQQGNTCAQLTGNDKFEMRRLIHHSEQTNKEHGFLKCSMAQDSRGAQPASFWDEPYVFCTGDECSIRLTGCDKPLVAFHTHPSAAGRYAGWFSLNDIRNVWNYDRRVGCIGYMKDGKTTIKCVDRDHIHPEDLAYTQANLNEYEKEFRAAGELSPLPGRNVYDLPEPEFRAVVDELFQKNLGAIERLERASGACEEVLVP